MLNLVLVPATMLLLDIPSLASNAVVVELCRMVTSNVREIYNTNMFRVHGRSIGVDRKRW